MLVPCFSVLCGVCVLNILVKSLFELSKKVWGEILIKCGMWCFNDSVVCVCSVGSLENAVSGWYNQYK